MEVEIVTFPETKVACIEHHGSSELEHQTARKLIAWKLENRLLDQLKYRNYGLHYSNYGLHYTDPCNTLPAEHHVDFCLSVEEDVGPQCLRYQDKIDSGPTMRSRKRRGFSLSQPGCGLSLRNVVASKSVNYLAIFPMIFHYVNVGPTVREEEMITDVYLPLKEQPGALRNQLLRHPP